MKKKEKAEMPAGRGMGGNGNPELYDMTGRDTTGRDTTGTNMRGSNMTGSGTAGSGTAGSGMTGREETFNRSGMNKGMTKGQMGMTSGASSEMPNGRMETTSDKGSDMPKGKMETTSVRGSDMPKGRMETTSERGSEMPKGRMEATTSTNPGMPGGGMGENASEGGGTQYVIVEMRAPTSRSASNALEMGTGLSATGFQVDNSYDPVPLGSSTSSRSATELNEEQTVLIRGSIDPSNIQELERNENVVKVWKDTKVFPFQMGTTTGPRRKALKGLPTEEVEVVKVFPMEGFAACPIGTCDCAPGVAKGNLPDVAAYLGVDQIWNAGFRGDGIVVAVVDGGITASGRSIDSSDTSDPQWPNKLISRVIGGWPTTNWGTTGVNWGWHGNMCATDVLGMAPNAQIYDIRIAGSYISNAIAGFQWAIDQHRSDGTPHILTNSWGIFQENWDTDYARNPNHPFTRKMVDAINEGILVLFAAGNCGATCPDGRCGTDAGPGKSIWGANSHPSAITVGAVNKNEQFVGYSSQGPGALDANKPDFCSVTHFEGFFSSDSGTSAATPIAAGVIALLKQANPQLTQDQVKTTLRNTAKDIGPAGWDQHSGAGIIRPKQAFDTMQGTRAVNGPVVSWGQNRLDAFVIGTDRALYHKWYDGVTGWGPSATGYENLGGIILDSPEVVSWGPNRLDAFVLGTDMALYHKWFDGATGWGPSATGYEYMGGIIQGQPKVVSWGQNRLDAFVIGTDSALYHKWYDGASGWGPSVTDYEYLGGTIIGSPEVVCWGPNRLDIFAIGTDSALYHKWYDGATGWGPSATGWEYMGGTILGQPKVVSWGPNRLDVFVIGTDLALYHKWWDGATGWGPSLTGWEYMGGIILGSPEVVSWGQNRLDVFAIGTDSALYHKWYDGATGWGPSLEGYEYLGGIIKGQPRVVSWGANRLDAFVIGTDSALYHKWYDGATGWGPSATGYENLGGTIVKF